MNSMEAGHLFNKEVTSSTLLYGYATAIGNVIEARRFQVYHDIEAEDHGYAIVQYQNGGIGMIEASTASTGLKKEMIEISGTKGSIAANYQEILTFDVEGLEKPVFTEDSWTNERLFERLAADFVQAIDEDRLPFVDGDSARTATELIHAIYIKAGEPIYICRLNQVVCFVRMRLG